MRESFRPSLILVSIIFLIGFVLSDEIPVGRIWERVDVRDDEEARAFLIDGSVTYVVGTGGAIWSSSDRENWTVLTTRVTEDLNALAKGGGTFVVVGEAGRILSGPINGEWIAQPSGVFDSLNSVTYGGGYFVAVGNRGVILQSRDGEVWIRKEIRTEANLRDVIWDGEKFHLVGDVATVATAEAGGEWTIHPQAQLTLPRRNFGVIQFIDGEYVINANMYSSDGVTYLPSDDPQPFTSSELAAGAGVNVGINFGKSKIVGVSEDSRSWVSTNVPVGADFVALEFDGSDFLAMTAGRRFHTSADGSRWTGRGLGASVSDAVWTGSQYIVLGLSGIVSSSDGRIWTTEVSYQDLQLRAVEAGGGNIVAVGTEMTVVHSTNGRDWQKVELEGAWDLLDVAWSGSEFYAVGSLGVIFTSPDGLDWEMKSPGELQAVTWDGSRYLAVSGPNVLESEDGNDWSPLGVSDPDFDDEMSDVHWSNGRYVAVGESGQAVTSTDGVVWTKIDQSQFSNPFLSSVTSSGSRWVITSLLSLYYSDDGLIWTRVDMNGRIFSDVAHNGSIFMAVGLGGVITSTNGLQWTRVLSVSFDPLNSVAWTGSEWVIGGADSTSTFIQKGIIYRSANGTDFTLETRPDIGNFLEVGGRDGELLALAEDGQASRFIEGVWVDEESGLQGEPVFLRESGSELVGFANSGMSANLDAAGVWSQGSTRIAHGDFHEVVAGGGRIVIGTDGRSFNQGGIITSADGENWNESIPSEPLGAGTSPIVAGIWTGAEFVILARNGGFTSADGVNWTEEYTGIHDEFSVGFFNGRVIYGGQADINATRMSWRQVGGEIEGTYEGLGAVKAIVANGSEVLALGSSRNLVSTDGNEWQALSDVEGSEDASEDLLDVTNTPVGFVAVGLGGKVRHSVDGVSWQEIETGGGQLNAVSYGAGKVVAVGKTVVTSVDGENWVPVVATSPSGGFVDVAWSGERFVAVGDGLAAYSTNGEVWEEVAVPGELNTVTTLNGHFFAGDADGKIFFSEDGSSWVLRGLPRDIESHATGNGLMIVATRRGDFYKTSDGESWERAADLEILSDVSPTAVRFENNLFFLQFESFSRQHTLVSPDGENWTQLPLGYLTVRWTGSRFIALRMNYDIASSVDAVNWDNPFAATRSGTPIASVWTGTDLIAVGSSGGAYSLDGDLNWTNLDSGSNRDLVDVVWNGSQAVALDEDGALVFFGEGPALPEGLLGGGLLMLGSDLIVACQNGMVAVLRNGSWTVTDTGAISDLKTITVDGGDLVASGKWGTVVRSVGSAPSGSWNLERRSPRQLGSLQKLFSSAGELGALRSDGRFVKSEDGVIWGVKVEGEPSGINAVLEGEEGELLTFGQSGEILRVQENGMVLAESSGSTRELFSAAQSADRMVTVGEGGVILVARPESELASNFSAYIARAGGFGMGAFPDSDWDQDGVTNFMEYVLGLNSGFEEPADSLESLFGVSSGSGFFQLTFEAFTNFPDVEMRMMRSDDLSIWEPAAVKLGSGRWGGTAVVSESIGSEGRTKVTVTDPVTEGPRYFYRLEVTPR